MNDESYLIHYGIKGQKWGVRRFQNVDGKKRYSRSELKDIRSERRNYQNQAAASDENFKKALELQKEARKLADKYGLDYDDGGGGDGSRAAEAASRKYMDMWDEISLLQDEAHRNAVSKTEKYILDKYGKTAVDQLAQQDMAAGIAFSAAIMAIPVVMLFATSR